MEKQHLFGEMGVQTVDNKQYISFSVEGEYESDISNGMAWGIKTKSDGKFFPIFYIKDFTMGAKDSDTWNGSLVLTACDIILDGLGTGITTGGIRIEGDPTGNGLSFYDVNNASKFYMQIFPENILGESSINILNDLIISEYQNSKEINILNDLVISEYQNSKEINILNDLVIKNYQDSKAIDILDKINFAKNQAGSNSFKIGDDSSWVLLTDAGDISCQHIYCDGDIYSTGNLTAVKSISTEGYVNGKKFIDNSREETKKNIQKYTEKAIDIVKSTDIYEFNYKTDTDTSKKSIGFVIGDKYKYSKELTSIDEKGEEIGANLYSMISVAYKAIQEQQEIIEQLQTKIKEMEDKLNEIN